MFGSDNCLTHFALNKSLHIECYREKSNRKTILHPSRYKEYTVYYVVTSTNSSVLVSRNQWRRRNGGISLADFQSILIWSHPTPHSKVITYCSAFWGHRWTELFLSQVIFCSHFLHTCYWFTVSKTLYHVWRRLSLSLVLRASLCLQLIFFYEWSPMTVMSWLVDRTNGEETQWKLQLFTKTSARTGTRTLDP